MRKYILAIFLFSSLAFISFENKSDFQTVSCQKTFTLFGKGFQDNGQYPKIYTCDSLGISPALYWENAPKGTQSFAITMHHFSPKGERHVYMILYDIPKDVFELDANTSGIGVFGKNTINDRNEYAPPCSKGPGPKLYIITAYALSSKPELNNISYGVDMDAFQEAIKGIKLDSSVINVYYSRQPKS